MVLDPTKHADWEIAAEAETRMKTVYELGEELGLEKEELLPYGHYVGKLDFNKLEKVNLPAPWVLYRDLENVVNLLSVLFVSHPVDLP